MLDYDPVTGLLTWRARPNGAHVRAGKRAGCKTKSGYVCLMIDRRWYLAHRVIWVWMTGALPAEQIDHRNRIKSDNRWTNLREADPNLNSWNRRVPKTNRTGMLGAHVATARPGRFRSVIGARGRYIWLGSFATAEAANAAYLAAKAILHPGAIVADRVIR